MSQDPEKCKVRRWRPVELLKRNAFAVLRKYKRKDHRTIQLVSSRVHSGQAGLKSFIRKRESSGESKSCCSRPVVSFHEGKHKVVSLVNLRDLVVPLLGPSLVSWTGDKG